MPLPRQVLGLGSIIPDVLGTFQALKSSYTNLKLDASRGHL